MKARSRAEAVRRGENVRERTTGIRLALLTSMCKALLQLRNGKSYENRAIILCLYYAIGRGGEVSVLNFDNLRWDVDDDYLWTGWNEFKTGHSSEISYHPSATSYAVDILHALACYIVTAGGKLSDNKHPDEPTWLFPNMADLADGGPAAKTSRIISSLIGSVDGLGVEHTSHGLRVGSSDDLAMNELIDIVALIALGGW